MNKKKDDFLFEEMKKEGEKTNESKEKESIFFDFGIFISVVKILIAFVVFYACFLLFASTLNDLSEVYDNTNSETETMDTVTKENSYDTNDFLRDYYVFFGGSYYGE